MIRYRFNENLSTSKLIKMKNLIVLKTKLKEKQAVEIQKFQGEVRQEVERARDKFPLPDGLMCALMEEVGELAKAMMDESEERIRAEAVQVAAMAVRIALEGDPSLNTVRKFHSKLR